jgi:hypothetical protein
MFLVRAKFIKAWLCAWKSAPLHTSQSYQDIIRLKCGCSTGSLVKRAPDIRFVGGGGDNKNNIPSSTVQLSENYPNYMIR